MVLESQAQDQVQPGNVEVALIQHFFAFALRANGLDGGHAPAGIALMAGEAGWPA